MAGKNNVVEEIERSKSNLKKRFNRMADEARAKAIDGERLSSDELLLGVYGETLD